MLKNKKWRVLIAIISAIALMSVMSACGGGDENAEEETTEAAAATAELTADQMDSLMQQVADQEIEKTYSKYVPDEAFANAEVFGIDRDGDSGTAYVVLDTAEFVAFKGKAYNMSGSQGEAIIKFTYTDDQPKLDEVVWSADGSELEAWVKDNFPEEYYEADQKYEAHDEDGQSKLMKDLYPAVEEVMGVPVDTENILTIDLEGETYELEEVIESTDENGEYQFDTKTIDKGNLSDLNS